MSHIVDIFTEAFGAGGSVIVGIRFIITALLGALTALRGRQVIMWIVGFFAAGVGILGGAAFGLLVFDSFIIMLITAFLGGAALLLLVRFVKGLGRFIGMGALGFLIAFIITSELYIDSAKITENTLVFFDLIIGVLLGILAAVNSDIVVTLITAAAGGMVMSISVLALFGVYFADWRMWILAAVAAVFGAAVQFGVGGKRKKRS